MDTNISLKTDNTKFHCQDCNITVHQNDRDNHLNGSRHKYRVRRRNNENEQQTGKFECDICETKFTDFEFYRIHMGSKTHKRNVRRKKKSLKKKDESSPVTGTTENFLDFKLIPRGRRSTLSDASPRELKDQFCDYRSFREKYRPRHATFQEGHSKTYTISATAYWAVSLALDPTVEDFKICVNDKEWGDFGDAVIEITYKATREHPSAIYTFAIQFKQISNNDKSLDSFTEGRFSLTNFITQVNKIKDQDSAINKKFVVFTTASTPSSLKQSIFIKSEVIHKGVNDCPCNKEQKEVPINAKTFSNKKKHLMNTSDDNENIFFFFSTDSIHSLPKLYLYTRQKKVKSYARAIDEAVSDKLDQGRVEIHRDFMKYIEYWSEGYLGGNYKLKKEDVLVKLGELLLFKYKVPPQVEVSQNENYKIWNQAVNNVDITILAKNPFILSKVCKPINARIEAELALNIDTTTCSVEITQQTIGKIQNPVLKMYLFEETLCDIQDDVPLDVIYNVFWKAGLVPMILKAKEDKDQQHILEVIGLLKSFGLVRRYFLITSDQNIKTSLKYYKTLTFFVSLDDVARKLHPILLDQIKITVTDSFSISLKTIQKSDQYFQKAISSNEFFDLSLGKYSFKSSDNYLSRREEGVDDIKLILDDVMMVKLKKEIESNDISSVVLDKKTNDSARSLRGIKPSIFY